MRRSALMPILASLFFLAPSLPAAAATAAAAAPAVPDTSLVSFAGGALIVQAPQEYGGGWSAMYMLDGQAGTGWASPEKVLTPAVTVVEMSERSLLKRLEFD